jgi:hypothetical protein
MDSIEDTDVPLFMPGDSLIKETIQNQFPYGMVKRRNDLPSEKVQIDFDVEPLTHPMTAYCGTPGHPAFLKRHCLLLIKFSGLPLLSPDGPPSAKSRFYYACNGNSLLLLTGPCASKNIAELFRAEEINLQQVDPFELALFLCHILIPLGVLGYSPRGHLVVKSSADGAHFGVENNPLVEPPHIEPLQNGGWSLQFWTMYLHGGCTHIVPSLHEHNIRISSQFDISYEEKCGVAHDESETLY